MKDWRNYISPGRMFAIIKKREEKGKFRQYDDINS